MNNFKKVLSFALVLMMVVATMTIVPLTASAADLTSGGGSGTKDDPYIVLSKDDLYALGQAANVDDSWVGEDVYVEFGKSFSATEKKFLSEDSYGGAKNCKVNWKIDGNGYTMTQPKWPLLHGTGGGANIEIRNLNIEFLGLVQNANTMGAFIGCVNNATVLIENCTVSGTLATNYKNNAGSPGSVGGFVGQVYSGGTLTIKNCENNAAMDGHGYVGGFVGTMWDAGSSVNIINCASKGTVKGGVAGGIFGRYEAGSLSITDSYVAREVVLTERDLTGYNFVDGQTHVGGLVGGFKAGALTMTRCYAPNDALYDVEGAGGTAFEIDCYKGAAVAAPANAAAIAAITALAHAHIYDNSCDASCNVSGCTYVRPGVGHVVDSPCDLVCKKCGGETGSAGHQFDNACDPTCNVEGCGYVDDERDHVYDNPCDTTCNTCGATRTVGGHYYEDDADMDCNFCGYSRAAAAADTTAADDTTAAEDAKAKGCKKSIDSTYAVIALIAVLGFAFVAKKREEN